ncbi:hypothetical protein BDQ17DRAFT_1440928 [Cyathus striatus]|nr:hypothetical protein BDQ17DRAFT_1440928 [Cyathus striatus]
MSINDGVRFAIQAFHQLGTAFSPIQCLELMCTYSIKDWIDPGFQQLIKIPLWSISQEDTVRIGPIIYNALVITRAHINRLCASLAFCPPSIVNDPSCGLLASCSFGWEHDWWNGVAHRLLHPDLDLSTQDVLQELAATQPSGVCNLCHQKTVQWITEKETFKKEEEYIDEAIVALSAWQETGKIPQLC